MSTDKPNPDLDWRQIPALRARIAQLEGERDADQVRLKVAKAMAEMNAKEVDRLRATRPGLSGGDRTTIRLAEDACTALMAVLETAGLPSVVTTATRERLRTLAASAGPVII